MSTSLPECIKELKHHPFFFCCQVCKYYFNRWPQRQVTEKKLRGFKGLWTDVHNLRFDRPLAIKFAEAEKYRHRRNRYSRNYQLWLYFFWTENYSWREVAIDWIRPNRKPFFLIMIMDLGTALSLDRWRKHFPLKHWHYSTLPFEVNIKKQWHVTNKPLRQLQSITLFWSFQKNFGPLD